MPVNKAKDLGSNRYGIDMDRNHKMIILQFVVDDGLNVNILRNIVDFIQPLPENDLLHLHARQRRAAKTRNVEYFELTIPTYTDDQFREHFRMTRITFEARNFFLNYIYIYPEKQSDDVMMTSK